MKKMNRKKESSSFGEPVQSPSGFSARKNCKAFAKHVSKLTIEPYSQRISNFYDLLNQMAKKSPSSKIRTLKEIRHMGLESPQTSKIGNKLVRFATPVLKKRRQSSKANQSVFLMNPCKVDLKSKITKASFRFHKIGTEVSPQFQV